MTEIAPVLFPERYMPRVIPHPWRLVDASPAGDGFRATNPGMRAVLIVTLARYDGQPWLHASMSCADRVPTWKEMQSMKLWVAGPDRSAYQVHPPESEYVNDHPHVLHLWVPLDHRPLPDFRIGGTL